MPRVSFWTYTGFPPHAKRQYLLMSLEKESDEAISTVFVIPETNRESRK
jgi:hypothetical protein